MSLRYELKTLSSLETNILNFKTLVHLYLLLYVMNKKRLAITNPNIHSLITNPNNPNIHKYSESLISLKVH